MRIKWERCAFGYCASSGPWELEVTREKDDETDRGWSVQVTRICRGELDEEEDVFLWYSYRGEYSSAKSAKKACEKFMGKLADGLVALSREAE